MEKFQDMNTNTKRYEEESLKNLKYLIFYVRRVKRKKNSQSNLINEKRTLKLEFRVFLLLDWLPVDGLGFNS